MVDHKTHIFDVHLPQFADEILSGADITTQTKQHNYFNLPGMAMKS